MLMSAGPKGIVVSDKVYEAESVSRFLVLVPVLEDTSSFDSRL